ncbi:hypothetical protein QRB41_26420, partial [Mycobacterium avium subsp. hominissuis]|uniref:hypothetical protein n=1 Tax=Mycobacterium avium TaxID=1764 RepID=UPI002666A712
QFLITLMVHTTKLKPAGHATDHIGKINDEWPPRDSHPERRSTLSMPRKVTLKDHAVLLPRCKHPR